VRVQNSVAGLCVVFEKPFVEGDGLLGGVGSVYIGAYAVKVFAGLSKEVQINSQLLNVGMACFLSQQITPLLLGRCSEK
jgi:hypothetical protein